MYHRTYCFLSLGIYLWGCVGCSAATVVKTRTAAYDTETVRQMVSETSAPEDIRSLCAGLISASRGAQALACLSAAEQKGVRLPELWVGAFSAIPIVSPTLTKSIIRLDAEYRLGLGAIDRCTRSDRPPITLPRVESRMSAWGDLSSTASVLFVRVAESTTQPSQKACLLANAAAHCLHELGEGECAAKESLARYAGSLAQLRQNPSRDTLPSKKGVGGSDDLSELAQRAAEILTTAVVRGKNVVYRQNTRRKERAASTLYFLHFTLARIFAQELAQRDPGRPVRTREYHACRAQYFWTSINYGDEFPASFAAELGGIPSDCSRMVPTNHGPFPQRAR